MERDADQPHPDLEVDAGQTGDVGEELDQAPDPPAPGLSIAEQLGRSSEDA